MPARVAQRDRNGIARALAPGMSKRVRFAFVSGVVALLGCMPSSPTSPSPGGTPTPGNPTGGNPDSPGNPTDPSKPPTRPTGPIQVVYWGQNGYGGANPGDPTRYEKDLGQVCSDNPNYDMVVLSFVTSFVHTRNQDGYPEMNFANHCETPWDARNPFLLKCDAIATGIQTCHKNNQRVILSLGGASGSYGFPSDADAKTFAKTVWDMFLGGGGAIRPLGADPLDGIDLDIEGGQGSGYATFVKTLRGYMNADTTRPYYIGGAPQCPFPDAYLGPSMGSALGDAPSSFDYLFVQFYNNFCGYSAASPSSFADSFTRWVGLHANGGPQIVVGLPATTQAAAASSFVPRTDLPGLLNSVKSNPAFGGLMLWDSSFDMNSAQAGKTYGAFAKTLY
jgi:chitinase